MNMKRSEETQTNGRGQPVPLRALIIDDSENDAVLLARELKKGGYKVTWVRVETEPDIRLALLSRVWDIIFCDYHMPEMDGDKVIALVRNMGIETPFILISGVVTDEKAVEIVKAGADDFIMKSNWDRLIPVVRRECAKFKKKTVSIQPESGFEDLDDNEKHRFKPLIRWQILIGFAVAALIMLAAGGFVVWMNIRNATLQAESQARDIAGTVASVIGAEWAGLVRIEKNEPSGGFEDSPGLLESANHIQKVIDRIHSDQEFDITVIDSHQKIVADAHHGEKAQAYISRNREVMIQMIMDGKPRTVSGHAQEMVIVSPVRAGNKNTGAVIIDYSGKCKAIVTSEKNEAMYFAATLLISIFLSLLSGGFTGRVILSRIGILNQSVERLRGGCLESSVTITRHDEIGQVEASIEDMRKSLSRHKTVCDTEIEKRQSIETALLERNATLGILIRATPVAVITVDTELKVKLWNPAAETMFGWNAAEMIGQPLRINHPDDEADTAKIRNRLLKGKSIYPLETTPVRKNGERFSALLSASPYKDAEEHVKGIVLTFVDITERKKMENELVAARNDLERLVAERTSELVIQGKRLEHVISTSPAVIYVVNASERKECTFISPNVTGQTGWMPSDFMNTDGFWFSHVYPDDVAMVAETFPYLYEIGERVMEYRFLHKNGTYMWMHDQSHLIRDNTGEPVELVGSWIDITERKEMERTLIEARDSLDRKVDEQTRELTHIIQTLETRSFMTNLLNSISELLQAVSSEEEAMRVISGHGPGLFPGTSGCLYLVSEKEDRKTEWFETSACWGDDADFVKQFQTCDCWAVRKGREHTVQSPEGGIHCRHAQRGSDTGASTCFPVTAKGEITGLLHIRWQDKTTITDQARQILAAVTSQTGLCLSNIRLREMLHMRSIKDPLTGLYNRRYLEETLEREVRRATRHETGFALIMLDVDHFKRFNDQYGHDAGDAVLKFLGRYLQTKLRGEDTACRYGGEEFTLIMPGIGIEDAACRCEEIRDGAAGIRIRNKDAGGESVTISLGVAVYPGHGDSWAEVLEAADTALYRAKKNGRNRTERA